MQPKTQPTEGSRPSLGDDVIVKRRLGRVKGIEGLGGRILIEWSDGTEQWHRPDADTRSLRLDEPSEARATASPGLPDVERLRQELADMEAVGWPATSHEYRRGVRYALDRLAALSVPPATDPPKVRNVLPPRPRRRDEPHFLDKIAVPPATDPETGEEG
jgi:hypothetical protein